MPSKESRQLVLKRPDVPSGFQGKVFKRQGEVEGHKMCDHSSDWLVVRTGSQRHQPSGSSWSGVYLLVVSIQLTSSTWWGFQYLQNSSKDMAQNIIYSP